MVSCYTTHYSCLTPCLSVTLHVSKNCIENKNTKPGHSHLNGASMLFKDYSDRKITNCNSMATAVRPIDPCQSTHSAKEFLTLTHTTIMVNLGPRFDQNHIPSRNLAFFPKQSNLPYAAALYICG